MERLYEGIEILKTIKIKNLEHLGNAMRNKQCYELLQLTEDGLKDEQYLVLTLEELGSISKLQVSLEQLLLRYR